MHQFYFILLKTLLINIIIINNNNKNASTTTTTTTYNKNFNYDTHSAQLLKLLTTTNKTYILANVVVLCLQKHGQFCKRQKHTLRGAARNFGPKDNNFEPPKHRLLYMMMINQYFCIFAVIKHCRT